MRTRVNSTVGLAALCVVFAPILGSCSDVQFERSPYAPRGVDVIYSEQEDMTFFVWRIRQEADLDRVEFEIHDGERYRSIDPERAPYPHEPYECDRMYFCIQFQFDGRWTPLDNAAPVRAIDSRHGTFASTAARYQTVEQTFSIDPMGIENNEAALPRRGDWFDDEEIPLRRTFQWTVVEGDSSGGCQRVVDGDWSALRNRVELPRDWMNSTPCLAVRPDRRDGDGTQLARRITYGAELYPEQRELPIPPIDHPILVAFLADMQVASETRCNAYVDSIRDEIFSTLDELKDDPEDPRDITHRDLGVYRPIDPDGSRGSPCDQGSGSRYPTGQILLDADQEAASFGEPVILVLVYLNNVDLAISEAKHGDLEPFFDHLEHRNSPPGEPRSDPESDPVDPRNLPNPYPFPWVIGSNEMMANFNWAETTPWAALEDDNFLPSIESSVEASFPLRSRDFDDRDSITLLKPHAVDAPRQFRVCRFTPPPDRIHLPPDPVQNYSTDTWPWPDDAEPQLLFDLPPQNFVRFTSFHDTRANGVYEVCDAHCDGPFLGGDGVVRESWLATSGVCRWD